MIDTSRYSSHIPVLFEDCMRLMDPKPGELYADGTIAKLSIKFFGGDITKSE